VSSSQKPKALKTPLFLVLVLLSCNSHYAYLSNKYSIAKSLPKMHILQPKHIKLNQEEIKKLLQELNVSLSQLPKIKAEDKALPKECKIGDIIKIERAFGENKINYYRVVV